MSKMLIEKISAKDAFERAGKNDLRRYPAPDRDGERLYPLANPIGRPSFTIARSDRIFTIGSCFARNIEAALDNIGMDVVSRELDLGKVGDSLGQATNFFNKYSIHSILNELRWALEPDSFPGKPVLYPLRGNSYADLQLGMAKLSFSINEIMAFRRRYLEVLARVATADVVIITLGYVETWYDTHLDIYLNTSPNKYLIDQQPERFEFRVLDYEEILIALRDVRDLLQKHRSKPLKMLVTVSPVPLLSTFRDMDVLLANSYSKTVQRAALEQFVLESEGVDYFPSYEFVTLSNPTIAWARGDYRHVSPDLVARIMSNVITSYVEDSTPTDANAMTPEGAVSSVRILTKLQEYQRVIDLCKEYPKLFESTPELLINLGNAYAGLQNYAKALELFEKVISLAPRRPGPLERLITLCRPARRADRARECLEMHKERFPGRQDFRDRINWL